MKILFVLYSLFISSFHVNEGKSSDFKLVGSTPGGEEIKTSMGIARTAKVDFIKWQINFIDKSNYELNLHYGESQPNTMGFIAGGEKKTFKGQYQVLQNVGRFKEVATLVISQNQQLKLVKVSENVYHILNEKNGLMYGNGGWSYSLFRKEILPENDLLISTAGFDNQSKELVFDGRTPCQEFAKIYSQMKVSTTCFKLKWKFVIYCDKEGDKSGKCLIKNVVNNSPREIEAHWEIYEQKDKIFYKILETNLDKPILFFIADESVIFFVDENMELFIGNEDFGFALNKSLQKNEGII